MWRTWLQKRLCSRICWAITRRGSRRLRNMCALHPSTSIHPQKSILPTEAYWKRLGSRRPRTGTTSRSRRQVAPENTASSSIKQTTAGTSDRSLTRAKPARNAVASRTAPLGRAATQSSSKSKRAWSRVEIRSRLQTRNLRREALYLATSPDLAQFKVSISRCQQRKSKLSASGNSRWDNY